MRNRHVSNTDITEIEQGDIITWKHHFPSDHPFVSEYVVRVDGQFVQTKSGYWVREDQLV